MKNQPTLRAEKGTMTKQIQTVESWKKRLEQYINSHSVRGLMNGDVPTGTYFTHCPTLELKSLIAQAQQEAVESERDRIFKIGRKWFEENYHNGKNLSDDVYITEHQFEQFLKALKGQK